VRRLPASYGLEVVAISFSQSMVWSIALESRLRRGLESTAKRHTTTEPSSGLLFVLCGACQSGGRWALLVSG
jgi:hypothetical protein